MIALVVTGVGVLVATLLGYAVPVLLWRWMHGRWPWELK